MKKIISAPSVQVLTGAEGIKSMYERTLESKRVDFICTSAEFEKLVGGFWSKYAEKLYGSRIKTREILPDNQENREYAKKKDVVKNEVRFVDPKYATETDLVLTEDMLALVSYSKDLPLVVVISEPEIVRAQENQFNLLWECVGK